MEFVIISGGVAAEMSNDVTVIDLDDLEDGLTDPSQFAEKYDALIGSGFDWVQERLADIWKERYDTHQCPRCGTWVADEGGTFVDITGGDVCVDLEGVEGEHTL